MKTKDFTDALKLIEEYKTSPTQCLHLVLNEKGLPFMPFERSEEYLKSLENSIDSASINAVNLLTHRLDQLNIHFVQQLADIDCRSQFGVDFKFLPINRVGIYIPYRMPSSAFTFLSAIKSAGCKELVVYLPIDDKGDIDPLSVYIARQYGAKILAGPGRLGFLTLSFGFSDSVAKCDLVCGPCSNKQIALKNASALIAEIAIDMSAGASDLTIIVDKLYDLDIIKLDLLSQLEHGKDSSARLIVVGEKLAKELHTRPDFIDIKLNDRIEIYYARNVSHVNQMFQTISAETLMLYSDSPENYINLLQYCGVAYSNISSTLGDYAVIGRSCADPTSSFARGQSGISPLKFMKLVPLVFGNKISTELVKASLVLSKYENLKAHSEVILQYL